jgi:tRNA(Ile)-lysidine synthase
MLMADQHRASGGVMSLKSSIRRTIRQHALARADTRVLVALSGGADSLALLHLLREMERSGDLVVAGAAHLHHGLRGADADADQAFCRALAERLNVGFVTSRVDVASLACEQKRSIEDAARSARYAFLERAADELGADAIATAHTLDDQAETFLLRLLRGTATRGLGSIRPRVGRVIRPVLEIRRADLRQFLEARGEAFREDATNADVSIPRNRVRHELIPYIESRFSRAAPVLLARQAALARDDEDFLRELAIESVRRVVLRENGLERPADFAPRTSDLRPGTPDVGPRTSDLGPRASDLGMDLDAAALAEIPRAVASRVAYHVLSRLSGVRHIGSDHVERFLALAEAGHEGSATSLPGQYAQRLGSVITLRPGRGPALEGSNSFAFSLSIPGEVEWRPQRCAIAAEAVSGSEGRLAARGAEVGVSVAALALPLAIRSRRPGDRFHPLGAPGARKLQDFLVDRKVPRSERDALPLVVDSRDRIVWVVGHSVGEDFRVIDPSAGMLLLKVRRLGGVG